ncbi:MAG TPA: bifunctional YncE family protein/alkaline phosphatase family protein [Verrucomicrobiae bacterium]|nr:bifunctional YncE family protein/alkaline phosphatase family protein [Verrucomicrobiae bacterium]
MTKALLAACSCLLLAPLSAPALQSPPAKIVLPGQRDDGSVLLPNQWSLRPAGRQVDLGDLPVNIAVHPDGRYAAVLECGHGPHGIAIVDIQAAKVVSRTKINEGFYGIEFSNTGSRLYCSGSSDEVIHVFDFKDGALTTNQDIHLRDVKQRGIPCGLAVSPNGLTLYAANVWGQRVSEVDLLHRTNLLDIFPGVGAPPEDLHEFVFKNQGPVDPDLTAITKRAEARLDPASPDAPFPYACRLDEKRHRLYVSLWAQSCVSVIDLNSGKVVERWFTEEHPNEMVLSKAKNYLFVANANRNTVSVIDTVEGKTMQTLFASLSPSLPPGSTPNSLALSPDETLLFVANACNNNLAVFDVSIVRKARSLGFIPVGWYPTSVRVTPDGKHLLVANGKGLASKPNPTGPVPGRKGGPPTTHIADLFPGTLSIIDLPRREEFLKQLPAYTREAYRCTPQESVPQAAPDSDNPVPTRPGRPSPIKYCIYIIKENRTYDQVFGDLPQGNGDAKLCLFPEKATPNHHKLARDFVLLDNFYVDAEVSADGHEWSMAAYATDFVEKTWPLNYGHGQSKKFPYPAEGQFPIASPASGYIWDRALEAGVSYRSFGEFIANGKTPQDPGHSRIAALQGHFDPMYRSFDTDYPDVKRAGRFIGELKRFESEGDMPRLQIVRLPNDHTAGTVPKAPTPTAYLGDNDRGLGMVVEAVSHSKFWPQTAIFVLEDDAQNGPDHVDAHRSPAFVISPYTRSGKVDSTMYSTSSMLRTMELILGLKPMTQFDAAATPMFKAFQAKPNLEPYDALPAGVDLDEKNTVASWGSKASRKMDFSKEDATDEMQLNEIIWRSVRGSDHPMPGPTHAGFVFTTPKTDSDGD